MPVNQLNLPAIYGAAEQFKGQQTRNALASQLGPLQVEGQQIQNRLGQQQLTQASQPQPVDPEDLARAIEWADTPEKWDRAVDTFIAEGRPEFARYKGQFGKREEYLALVASQKEKNDPKSPLGKLARDFEAGIIDEPTYRAAVVKATTSKPLVQVNMGQAGIDYGDPPKDHAWARGPDGKVLTQADPETGYESPIAVPIAGGPVATKREGAAETAETKQQMKETQADIVAQDVDRAIEMVEGASVPVTGVGSFLSAVPGTKARDLAATLDTIRANVGFDKLQAMREASPTGGALGQVSEMENKLLQSVLGNLEQSQSKEQFMFNLKRLKETYLDIIHGPGERPGQAPDAGQAEETKTLNGKTYVKTGGKWYEQ